MERWKISQAEVEKALARGPQTIKQVMSATGYSYNTVRVALSRCAIIDRSSWPYVYSFQGTALVGDRQETEIAETVTVTEYVNIVEPREFPVETVGQLWRDQRGNLAKSIIATDPDEIDLADLKEKIESFAAQLLGIHIALSKVEDGPEWRDLVGLTELP